MRFFSTFTIMILLFVFHTPAAAQQGGAEQKSACMPGMSMPGCPDASSGQQNSSQEPGPEGGAGAMNMQPETFIQEIEHHGTSGTTAEPDSTPTPMWMAMKGRWM